MSLYAFCTQGANLRQNISTNLTILPTEQDLVNLKGTFRTIMEIISAVGVVGNVMNLITLRRRTLQTVPFVFIRALAIFDLISLTAIFIHFLLETIPINLMPIIVYSVWIEDVLINAFLVAGLYCAVLLTIERYMLIRKPLKQYRISVEKTVKIKIWSSLLFSVAIHCPQVLQNTIKHYPETGKLLKGNNEQFLCQEPHWTIFNYYKLFRELLRFFCVLLLISLNIIIVRRLHVVNRKRQMLFIKRQSLTPFQKLDDGNGSYELERTKDKISRRDHSSVVKSFTEKKLSALMLAICIIYAIGNLPQMAVMILQNEGMNNSYKFQLFRQIANSLEVLNHCINFFIFCIASSEYTRAFMSLRFVQFFSHRIQQFTALFCSRKFRPSRKLITSDHHGRDFLKTKTSEETKLTIENSAKNMIENEELSENLCNNYVPSDKKCSMVVDADNEMDEFL